MDKTKTYTAKEVAERAGVSDRTLRRWLQTGKVPSPARDRNNRPAFTKTTLDAILKYANQMNPAPSHHERVHVHAAGVRA